jgi:SAM-dependent methyltransferase
MDIQFNTRETKKINKGIQKKYKKVARSPNGLFKYPTGRVGLEALNYDPELVGALPEAVLASYCGVGNPFSLGPINAGETVLDIGCGAGVDTFVAAMMTGPSGKAVGIDLIASMLQRARENLTSTGLKNVTFEEASSERLPFADQSFDAVISNGVFNLVPDKLKALSEVYRVLKQKGRLMIADQVLIGELPKERKQIIKSWSQ